MSREGEPWVNGCSETHDILGNYHFLTGSIGMISADKDDLEKSEHGKLAKKIQADIRLELGIDPREKINPKKNQRYLPIRFR